MADFLNENLQLALAAVGGIVLIRFACSFVAFLYSTFLSGGVNVKKLGSWAVVTGATDGIGKALAKELAERGLNIVLVSRTQERLNETSKELNEKYPKVEIKTVTLDFSSATAADYDRLKAVLSNLEIGVLYNNVGVSYDYAEALQNIPDEKINALIEVNNRSLVKLSQIVLPAMIQRKKGAIINIGSFYGSISSPFYAVYCASKAFVEYFSRSLSHELKNKGVLCQNHLPLMVATKLAIPNPARRARGTLFTPLPEVWAKASVNSIGSAPSVIPYWAHRLQAAAMLAVPAWVLDMAVYSTHDKIRRAALKKRENAKSQ